jgi:hypothetical protein
MHKPTPEDAKAAFQKYRRVTGDTDAELVITRQEIGPTIFELRGDYEFRVYGAATACEKLGSYNDGYRDGLADATLSEEMAAP